MGRYVTTSGSNFTPFSYDELVKPLEQMTLAHQETNAAYDELASATAKLEQYVFENPEDTYAQTVYKNYMDKLQSLQDNLNANGYNQAAVRDVSSARKLYNSNIVPIDEALARRRKWSDEWKKTSIDHPTRIMGKDPGTYALHNYLDDSNFGGFNSYDATQLESLASSAAKAAASALRQRPRKWTTAGVPEGYAESEMTTGYTENEVELATAAFMNHKDSTGNARADELLKIAQDVYAQSGISSWEGEYDDDRIFTAAAQAIGTGLRSGVGETKYELVKLLTDTNNSGGGRNGSNDNIDTRRYGKWTGIGVSADSNIKKLSEEYASDLSRLDYLKNHPEEGKDDDYAKAATIVLQSRIRSRQGFSPISGSKEYRKKFPEFNDMDDNTLYNIGQGSVYDIYDKLGLEGEDRNVDTAIKILLDKNDELVKRSRDYEYNSPSENLSSMINSNTKGRKETKGDYLDTTLAHGLDGSRVSKDEFDAALKDVKTKYYINPREGNIIMYPSDSSMIVLSPSVIDNMYLGPDNAYRITRDYVMERGTGATPASEALYRYLYTHASSTDLLRDLPGFAAELRSNSDIAEDDVPDIITTVLEAIWGTVTNSVNEINAQPGDTYTNPNKPNVKV